VHAIGAVDAVMYPGTQAFMRFEMPSKLPPEVQTRALDVARRFLQAVGFTHGLFNMEFFYDATTDRLTVIEFNPRMAAQFSDLYLRVQGLDLHAVSLALAYGQDPVNVAPTASAAASFVYRVFDAQQPVVMPDAQRRQALVHAFPDALLFAYPKPRGSMERDFKWLGSYRYGIVHLGGSDSADLYERCTAASELLGWPVPYREPAPHLPAPNAVSVPATSHPALPAMSIQESSA